MAYHVVDPDDLAATEEYPCDRRSVADAADLSTVAAAVYELAPGQQLARTYHYHEHREELFYVLAGTLAVETPEEEYEVPAGSVFVATPNSPIRPYNPASAVEDVRVFGVGAPQYDVGRAYDPESGDEPADNHD
ncbi:MAG: cupin domain-containing protein [Haloarculaceae archaeon]